MQRLKQKCDKEEEEETEADEEVRAEEKEEEPWAVREGCTQRPEADERKADAGVSLHQQHVIRLVRPPPSPHPTVKQAQKQFNLLLWC